jgi:hypothetical protein
MNKNYASGRAFEYEVRDYFEEKGFFVFRSAGSHTQADLICLPEQEGDRTVIIQCKKYAKYKPKPDEDFKRTYIPNTIKYWCTKKKGQKGFDMEAVFDV